MREIKFRAWDKINEFMGEVLQIDFEEETVFCTTKFIDDSNKFSFEEVEFLQYTGLKDKNGREIYEGDLFLTNNGIRFVNFEDGVFWTYKSKGIQQESLYFYVSTPKIEVIGNIYENPELLEVNNAND